MANAADTRIDHRHPGAATLATAADRLDLTPRVREFFETSARAEQRPVLVTAATTTLSPFVLGWLRDVYALTVIERDLAWFVVNGRLSTARARALGTELDGLLRRLRPHVLDLVDAWGLGDDHLRAVIATSAERTRQDEARAYYAGLRESGAAPRPEKSLQR